MQLPAKQAQETIPMGEKAVALPAYRSIEKLLNLQNLNSALVVG